MEPTPEKSGVTSAHDALGGPEDLRAYQDSYEAGELPLLGFKRGNLRFQFGKLTSDKTFERLVGFEIQTFLRQDRT